MHVSRGGWYRTPPHTPAPKDMLDSLWLECQGVERGRVRGCHAASKVFEGVCPVKAPLLPPRLWAHVEVQAFGE